MTNAAARGWWGLACWNALSPEQQHDLIHKGYLEIFSEPAGDACKNGAEIAIECESDEAPGPRFYCRPCAWAYLKEGGS